MYTRSIFTGNGFGNIKNIIQSLLKISAIRFFVPISLGTVFRQQITLQQIRAICIILDGEPIINLPPKTIELKKVDFTMEERDFYCRLEADSRAQFAEYAAAGTIKQNYINILLMLLRLRQACDHPLLVSGSGSNSVWTSSVEMAKKLTPEKQVSLLNCLEASLAICGICNVDDKLYIYLEYVSGGSIYKLLQEYGQFGELAIRSYTQQILSGLAYLHAKNTVHRDIKGANILVDPNGRVKLADFGMAKHITGQACPLSLKGSPYWMAPEVIKNANGNHLAVDIWSLGCTVLEMATTKPPWSQYEGVAAMFKIGNSKELPTIPDHMSDDGKDFVWQCLQRNPLHRPTAAKLLEHRFVKNASPMEKPVVGHEPSDPPPGITNEVKSMEKAHAKNRPTLNSDRLAIHSSRVSKSGFNSSDIHILRNISCPVSPIGSPLLQSRSPQQLNGRMSPSPISSPRTTSGSSTPLTGSSGAIPFHNLNYSVYLQELPKPLHRPCKNGNTYRDPNPDFFRGMQSGSQPLVLGKQFGRPGQGEVYEGQSVLADCVSQQLLRDHVNLKPSLDLNPCSPSGGNIKM